MPSPDAPVSTMDELGPYRVVRRMATGGMAEVFLARHRGPQGLERLVVLKRLLPRYVQDEEFVTMFLDEARLLARLNHPNIAQVLDLGEHEGVHYLVMEYVQGPTLAQLMEAASGRGHHGLPQKQALSITLELAEALRYLHEHRDELGRPLGIVHRDLNPANVVVGYEGEVKLIDFGIAKAATKVHETRTGVVKGTDGYLAPEQRKRGSTVDHRADVYALGVLLYEMCLGRSPHTTRLADGLRGHYVPPREVDPTFPESLDRLIGRALRDAPEERPHDTSAFVDELTAYMGQRAMVPTMRDRGGLAEQLVPREAGSSSATHPPEPRSAASDDDAATRELPAVAEAPSGGAEDGERTRPLPRSSPPSRRDTLSVAKTLPRPAVGASAPPSEIAPPRSSRRRGRRSGLGRVLAGLAVVAVLGSVGAAAYIGTRALDGGLGTQRGTSRGDTGEGGATERAVRVLSKPAGATVIVEGDVAGITPTRITIPPEREAIDIEVSRDGYRARRARIAAGDEEVRFELERQSGR